MPALKHDTDADRRSTVACLVAIASGVIGMLMWAKFDWALAGFLVVFLGMGFGVGGFFLGMYRYRCPQCGTRLPYRGGATPGSKALYHCHRCDVLWDTGLMDTLDPDPAAKPLLPLPPESLARIHELLFAGNKIEAIKVWRAACGGGLSEAVFHVGEIEEGLRAATPEKFPKARV